MGLCTGVHYAYGSFNHIKKPVILDSFFISYIGFFFSLIAGFMAYGAIGYLNAVKDPNQLQFSSVGLTFIAMPAAATRNESVGMYILFLLFMFATGITQVYGFVLGVITNLTDYFKCATWKAAVIVCFFALVVSFAFTSNSGWILFDLYEHFVLRYLLISVGFLQCIAVGWFFEYYSTAAVSKDHANSLRVLALMYWVPNVVICFYANFAIKELKLIGLILILVFTILAMFVSWRVSKMPLNSFYHEIVL
jgi:NSS family neurotransmitter:Na+ symporter